MRPPWLFTVPVLPPAAFSTPETLSALPHSRKIFVFPGAGLLQELLFRITGCRCLGCWFFYLPFIVLRNQIANYKRRIPSFSFLVWKIRNWMASLLSYTEIAVEISAYPAIPLFNFIIANFRRAVKFSRHRARLSKTRRADRKSKTWKTYSRKGFKRRNWQGRIVSFGGQKMGVTFSTAHPIGLACQRGHLEIFCPCAARLFRPSSTGGSIIALGRSKPSCKHLRSPRSDGIIRIRK